jgi:mannitol/fructose-specific phosphotransferase system IIA component
MIETIKKAITELNRDKEVIEPLRKLLDKGLVTVDYVRALEENNKISKTELFKIIS